MTNLHAAHTRGLIARLSLTVPEPPPPGERGTEAFAFRAGWVSADRALKEGKETPNG